MVKNQCTFFIFYPRFCDVGIQRRYFRHINHGDNALMVDSSAQFFKFLGVFNFVVDSFSGGKFVAKSAEKRCDFFCKVKAADSFAIVFFQFLYCSKTADGKFIILFISHADSITILLRIKSIPILIFSIFED